MKKIKHLYLTKYGSLFLIAMLSASTILSSCAFAGEDEPAESVPTVSIRETGGNSEQSTDADADVLGYTYSMDNPDADQVNLDGGGFTTDWHQAVDPGELSEKNVVSYEEMPVDMRSNEEFEYDVYEDHIIITKYIGKETSVTVPAEMDGLPVTQIGGWEPNSPYLYDAFRGTTVEEVIFSEGIAAIGDQAFFNCGQLKSIEIPDSVNYIGEQAFGSDENPIPWYRSLKESGEEFVIVGDGCLILYNGDDFEVTVPGGVKGIFGAFSGNEDIEEVTLPEGVTQIVAGFIGCTYLRSVNLPETIVILGRCAFEGCSSLREIEFPAGLEIIGRGAFFGCIRLKDIILGEKLEIIGICAFSDCESLTSVEFPESLLEIGEKAFYGCDALAEVRGGRNVEKVGSYAFEETPWIRQQTDYFVTVGKNVLIKYNGSDSEVQVPDTVTYIGGAFAKRSSGASDSLKKVILPDSVRGIAGNSFACRGVAEIVIEGEKTVLEEEAFSLCGLEAMSIPTGQTVLAGMLFTSSSVQEVEIPDGILSVGAGCFMACGDLQTVVLPETVVSIGDEAFQCCGALEDIYIPASVVKFGDDIFGESPKVTIHGEDGSAAEAYAEDHGIPFETVSVENSDAAGGKETT